MLKALDGAKMSVLTKHIIFAQQILNLMSEIAVQIMYVEIKLIFVLIFARKSLKKGQFSRKKMKNVTL